MAYRLSIETTSCNDAVKVADQENINQESTSELSQAKQGQVVTGTVVSVDEQITLDFDGEKVTTAKGLLANVKPGDVKNFEVIKITPSRIELRLLEENKNSQKIITALKVNPADWDTLMSQKEQINRKQEQETEYQNLKMKLEQISTTLTERDISLLEKEGFPVESFSIEGLAYALDRVRETYPDTDVNSSIDCNAPSGTQKYDRTKLAEKLREEHLPVTENNLSKLSQVLKMSDSISTMDDRAMQYLISKEVEPTVENIYKACYSKNNQSIKTTGKLTEEAWKELEGQVKDVIKAAGYEVSPQNLSDARWLIENQLPLTEETFTYKKDLDFIKSNINPKELLNRMLSGMKNGIQPKDISLRQVNTAVLQKLIDDIHTITHQTVRDAVQSNVKLTIKNLIDLQTNNKPETSNPETMKAEDVKPEDKVEAYVKKALDKIIKSADHVSNMSSGLETSASDIKQSISKSPKPSEPTDTGIDELLHKIDSKIGELSSQATDLRKISVDSLETMKDATKSTEVNKIIPKKASDMIQIAANITKEAVQISQSISETTGSAPMVNQNGELSDKAIEITLAAVNITKEISNIVDMATKLIDVTQDIENPVQNLIQTAVVSEEAKKIQTDTEQTGQDNSPSEEQENDDYQYEELKARRQLEEIRLKMTLDAAGRLESKGIKIDTQELTKVVDALREQENQYYSKLLSEADMQVTDTSIQTLKATVNGAEQLRYIPCSVLSSTLSVRNTQTISGLLTEGSKLQAEYAKAGTAYETLATVPNREYGDSIRKAFLAADSLLDQIGLENTEQNKRAIRVLGYNQMEITKEAVDQVKAYDRQVTDLITNLHPAVAVRMIKAGINPLTMPINELNNMIDQIKEDQGISSEDKFSNYLHSLEKQEGITPEERKAYIGIYRLLYHVDKSDGAALGSVIKADREVTLGNLLTAIQTRNKGNIETVVDDDFGALESVTHSKETIAQQLSSFTDSGTKEQSEYYGRILKNINEEVTPQKLAEATDNIIHSHITQEAGNQPVVSSPPRQGIWEQIKGVPIEKLLEQINNLKEETLDSEIAKAKMVEIQNLYKNAEQSIRFLNDYRLPSTSFHIMMANNLLSNGDSPLKKLIKQKNDNQVEKSEIKLKESNNLSDKLIDKNSMQEAYEALETDAKDALNKAYSGEILDSKRLAELKSIGQQMTFVRMLAEKEFYQIPIETDQGITNMNLTILRGTETSGKVTVNIWSNQLGNVKAEFSLKGRTLKGFFAGDNRDGLKHIQDNTDIIEAAAQESNVTIKHMDFGVQQKDNDSYNYQNPGEGNRISGDTERILYRIAKAVVTTVRSAENSTEEHNRAVS